MILREMLLLSQLLVLSRAWEILPVEVDENERRDRESNDPIQTIQNKEAMSYNIHGVDSEQFEIETINDGTCGNNYKTCGKLWLKSGVTLDREEKEVYQITVEAKDRHNQVLESSNMVVRVRDENDNAPIFTAASLQMKCPENAKNGDSCGFVEALDADAKRFGQVEYSLENRGDRWKKRNSNEIQTRQMGMFDVNPESGEIKIKNPQDWDAELYEYVEISVLAVDNPGKSAHNPPVRATIKIIIDDENDNEPQVVDYERQVTVGELAPAGEKLGTEAYGGAYSFRAVDKDVEPENREVTFRIVSPADSPFEIINQDNPENSALLQITNERLDFETRPEWILNIRAENAKAEEVKYQSFTMKITVRDENEPPIWDTDEVRFVEGDVNGAGPQGNVHPHARDLDFGGIQKIFYRKVNDPEDLFTLSRDTGRIKYSGSEPLNRECNSCDWKAGTYPLVLEACDEAGACQQQEIPIHITDKDDEGPRIDIDEAVCNVLDESYVLVKGERKIEVVDRDDCTLDHCGPFELDVIGQFKSKFKLEKQTERHYAIRHLKSGNLDVGETYDIQVQGFDKARNKHESMIRLRVCSCSSSDDTAACASTIVGAGGGSLASIMAIIAAVLIVFIVVLLLIVYRVRHRGAGGKDEPLIDADDETANIMVYHTEGGGEEDQTEFDPQSLIRARTLQNAHADKKPSRPRQHYPGIPPEDIGQYINAAKEHADEDPASPPYDSLLTFDYEGGNSICADLSSLGSADSDPDNDDNYLNNWGPKFRKLADLYAGRENEAYDPSNV